MRRGHTLFSGLLACAILSGCATVPLLPDNERLPIDAVIRNVRCELTRALSANSDQYAWLRNSAVAFQLTLRVDERGDGSADTAITFPIHSGAFTIGFTAGLSERATAKSELFIAAKYDDFNLRDCPEVSAGPSGSALDGDLGLAEWLGRAASAIEAADIGRDRLITNDKDTYIAHQVEFVLTVSGAVSPRFNIVKAGGRSRTGQARLGASREETNTLRIAVKPMRTQLVAVQQQKTTKGPDGAPLSVEGAPTVRRFVPQRRLDPATSEQLRDILRGLKLDDIGD